jgi:hypothetical protein
MAAGRTSRSVRLLQLAARTSECAVETVLGRLLDGDTRWDATQVKPLLPPDVIAGPPCALPPNYSLMSTSPFMSSWRISHQMP